MWRQQQVAQSVQYDITENALGQLYSKLFAKDIWFCNGIFFLKSSQVLRIITKWIEWEVYIRMKTSEDFFKAVPGLDS